MKAILISAVLALVVSPVLASDLGVSISVGQPGFYGRIEVGDYPSPQLIYQQPRHIHRSAYGREPIYLRVPPGHAKHWRKHCHRYDACGDRVYFVQNGWYQREYVPRYRERHYMSQDGRSGDQRGNGHDYTQGYRRHDGYDRGRGSDHGNERSNRP